MSKINLMASSKHTLELDVAGDCEIGEFLEVLESYQGKVVEFIACGPAGGNPLITMEFPDQAMADGFRDHYDGGYDPVKVVNPDA